MKQEAKIKRSLIPFTILAAVMIGAFSYFMWMQFSAHRTADYTEWYYSQEQESTPDILSSLQG
jgi:hypothetical protein